MKAKSGAEKRGKRAKRRAARELQASSCKVKRRPWFKNSASRRKHINSRKRQVSIAPKVVRFIEYIFQKVEEYLKLNGLRGDCVHSVSCPYISLLNNTAGISSLRKERKSGFNSAKEVFSECATSNHTKRFPLKLNLISNGSTGHGAFSDTHREGLRDLPSRYLRNLTQPRSIESISSILFPSSGPKQHGKALNAHRESGNSLYARSTRQNIGLTPLQSKSAKGSAINTSSNEDINVNTVPIPSGRRRPTFIAMVKTAIRDLIPYSMTSKDGISRYIHLRYQICNDVLLNYVLDWMEEMNILRNCDGYYLFTKNKLVKKTTVAVLQESEKSCTKTKNKRINSKKKKKARGETPPSNDEAAPAVSKRTKKNNASAVSKSEESPKKCKKRRRKNVATDNLKQAPPKKKDKKKQKKKKKGKKSPRKQKEKINCYASSDKDKVKCTCSKEIRSVKNRVKLGSRYTRRGGKIYKEDEYI